MATSTAWSRASIPRMSVRVPAICVLSTTTIAMMVCGGRADLHPERDRQKDDGQISRRQRST